MEFSQIHFSHPLWLWGIIVIPLGLFAFFLFYRASSPHHQLDKFIDAHLLPFLLVNHTNRKKSYWKTLLLWSCAWGLLILALAGPRWNLREVETFTRDQTLVILLDMSESMNAQDLKPSRLVRAKQKIEDIVNIAQGVKIGLIAFAADPHMITPITEDKQTIRHLLSTLETDLIYVQGSRLSTAFEMALTMLQAEPGDNKAVVVVSDGGIEDASAISVAKKLAEKGIVIHAIGVGTHEGAPLLGRDGKVIKKNGSPILVSLEKEKLIEISKIGNGAYFEVNYSDHGETAILSALEKRANTQKEVAKKHQFWDERFYLFIFPVLPILLWWYRKGYILAGLFVLFIPFSSLQADTVQDYFLNSEELGKQALDAGDYEGAIHAFQDAYRKGVAYYRAGKFSEAEAMFRLSDREEVAKDAAYNLGNSLVQQQKLKEAVTAYENVLDKWPDHTKAKDNLELVKKMMEEQKQEPSDSEDSDQKDDDQEEKESKEKEQSEGQKGENQETKDQQKEGKNSAEQDEESKENQEMPNGEEDGDSEEQKDAQEIKEEDVSEEEKNQQEMKEEEPSEEDKEKEANALQVEKDQDADQWLNRIKSDPKMFMKNKFYIESKKSGVTEGIDPW